MTGRAEGGKTWDFVLRRGDSDYSAGVGSCFHGGAFWDAIPLNRLGQRSQVINADVLDAWFPPAPAVIEALGDEWLYRTSPPTHAVGMEAAIGEAFDVPTEAVMAGPGSSALMFLAFSCWLTPASRVLLVEPTYGEYGHLCETVIGCRVDRFVVDWGERFDLAGWSAKAEGYDLVVLVNPNNPTGDLVPTAELVAALPKGPRVWIDEAYLAYADQTSAAAFAAGNPWVAVVRSFSKSHALSGVRSAALFAHPETLRELRPLSPPWWVSLPAQVATVVALGEAEYYTDRYAETHSLRSRLARRIGLEVRESPANWVLVRLPESGPTAAEVVACGASEGVYFRDAGRTAPSLGDRCLRMAVREEQDRMVEVFRRVLGRLG